MRIAIDARSAVAAKKTGVGYYTWNLIHALPREDPESTYVAWYPSLRGSVGVRRDFPELAGPNFQERPMPVPWVLFERISSRIEAPRVDWFLRFDVFLAPNFIPPPVGRKRVVVTIHDLAFRILPETASEATERWLVRLDASLRRATRFVAVSECTKQDLVNLYDISPDRVDVVPLGVDPASFRSSSAEEVTAVKRRFGIDGPYLLFLGGIERRKNIPAIVRAFSQMDPDTRPKLVVAGGAVAWDPLASRSLRMGFEFLPRRARENIVFTGYVTDEEKVALLGGAEALVYPSLYEGFGLPVLEAMACGTPVVTSNVSSLPEVVGDAALLVDPRDDDELADAMVRVLQDEALRDRLRVAGPARAATFTWDRTAQLTARTLRRAAGDS